MALSDSERELRKRNKIQRDEWAKQAPAKKHFMQTEFARRGISLSLESHIYTRAEQYLPDDTEVKREARHLIYILREIGVGTRCGMPDSDIVSLIDKYEIALHKVESLYSSRIASADKHAFYVEKKAHVCRFCGKRRFDSKGKRLSDDDVCEIRLARAVLES